MAGVLFVLAACLVGTGCEDRAPCEKPYTCPAAGFINCEPPGGSQNSLCVGECHDWIVDHCPDVEFVS